MEIGPASLLREKGEELEVRYTVIDPLPSRSEEVELPEALFQSDAAGGEQVGIIFHRIDPPGLHALVLPAHDPREIVRPLRIGKDRDPLPLLSAPLPSGKLHGIKVSDQKVRLHGERLKMEISRIRRDQIIRLLNRKGKAEEIPGPDQDAPSLMPVLSPLSPRSFLSLLLHPISSLFPAYKACSLSIFLPAFPFCSFFPDGMRPEPSEKIRHKPFTVLPENRRQELYPVIECRKLQDIQNGAAEACLRIFRPEEKPRYPRLQDRPRAHGAGLQRHNHRAVLQPPVPEPSARLRNRADLRVL